MYFNLKYMPQLTNNGEFKGTNKNTKESVKTNNETEQTTGK